MKVTLSIDFEDLGEKKPVKYAEVIIDALRKRWPEGSNFRVRIQSETTGETFVSQK